MAADRTRWQAAVALALLGLACEPDQAPPRDQWVVVVATDAPIPQLVDRLLIQVLDESGALACAGCRRMLAVSDAAAWPLSFGMRPPDEGGPLWVRATLYRTADMAGDGLPASDVLLDALGRLPAAHEVTEVVLPLLTDCFGLRADAVAKQTCDPSNRQLVPAAVLAASSAAPVPAPGSWPPAQETPCEGEVPEEMVCVPGGAFVLGNPESYPSLSQPERLVWLSPFALDVDEVTVGRVKELALAQPAREHDPDETSADHACQFLAGGSQHDDMPVNCVTYAQAEAICEAQGKRLPTEAEWEWAAGNRDQETDYPWGDDDNDVCSSAVVSRGRLSPLEVSDAVFEEINCRGIQSELGWGPIVGGFAADVTALGIRNLGGNLSEWVVDAYARYDEPCWHDLGQIAGDPVCTTGSTQTPGLSSVRGGSWVSLPFFARVIERQGVGPGAVRHGLGVRCALSMGSASMGSGR